eukprot:5263877-Prymnesium_polylepis.1
MDPKYVFLFVAVAVLLHGPLRHALLINTTIGGAASGCRISEPHVPGGGRGKDPERWKVTADSVRCLFYVTRRYEMRCGGCSLMVGPRRLCEHAKQWGMI